MTALSASSSPDLIRKGSLGNGLPCKITQLRRHGCRGADGKLLRVTVQRIAHTIKGKGVSFIEARPEWHHRVPKGDEINAALEELNHGE